MRYLYTDKPDDGCHEVAPGVFGRPVHTNQLAKMIKQGWKNSPQEVEPAKTLSMPKKADK